MLDYDIEFSEFGAQEVAALSNIASFFKTEEEGAASFVTAYQTQVQYIHRLIDSNECVVLTGLLDILLEGLKKLIDENEPLSADECQFLKTIPDILSEYINIPSSKIPDAHFLSHLKHVDWIRPITQAEEKAFAQFLMGESTEHELEKIQGCDNRVDNNDELDIDLSDLLTANTTELNYSDTEKTEDLAENTDKPELKQENDSFEEDAIDLIALSSDVGIETSDLLYESEVDVADIVNSDDFEEDTIDLTELSSYAGIDTEDALYESEVDPLEIVNNDIEPILPDETENVTGHPTPSPFAVEPDISFSLSEDQRELVELLISELEEVVNGKKLSSIDELPELKNHLISNTVQLDKISNATCLIGLEGLEFACRSLSSNMHTLASSERVLSKEDISLIEVWPQVLLTYLNNIAAEQASDDLVAYIKESVWSESISSDDESHLVTLLKNPQFFKEEKKLRQDTAIPDDMSLDLPEDVNPELLEGLLQDLPVQSEEFSTAIQNLSSQNNQESLESLEIAQRIAHTLKGAGNVVGVKGIANLTHHLEDILEIQTKANKLPSKSLLTVLINAADCLETMSEALLGIDEPPDNALTVFQSVLDWANKLDMEGATDNQEEGNDIEPAQLVKSRSDNHNMQHPEGIQSASKRPVSIENMLRVPASLADDLLRLAGENLISTSQIQEYIKTIQSRYVGLKTHNQSLQQLSFDLEHIVDVQGLVNNNNVQPVEHDFDPLELDQYHELHSMSRRLIEIAADSIELANVLAKDITNLSGLVINQDRLQKENEKLVLKTRMVPTKTIAPRLKRGVKQACRLTNKEADIEILDNDTYMDSEILNSLIEPLMHLLRNAVDHGIESAEERQQANKSSPGAIKIVFSRKGDQIAIDVEDDGRGLNLVKIREKAVSLGLAKSESEVTDINLKNFILRPGFSTSTEVSHISGRGIGLDVVHNKIRELKGSIEVSSNEGSGCHFSLTLPVSSFSIHSLLVRVRKDIYAFSNRGIEEVLYPGLGKIENVGDETVFKLDDQIYPMTLIDTLLNLPKDRRTIDRESRPVILVKNDSGATTAVLVQALIDSRNVVVKSMGAFIPKIQGVIGATVLGDGSIASVIDLPELLESASTMNYHLADNDVDADTNMESAPGYSYVLVVDDSLSARKSLAQFVQDLGFDVRTARDGLEAVSIIDSRKPGLVLVDMEMPGMNGLELTSYIRSSDSVREVPVIMITSRSTDKHRQVAMDKGVNHFMVKPFIEDELASHINLLLKIS